MQAEILFHNEDWTEEMDRQYTGPAQWYLGQNRAWVDNPVREGEIMKFHAYEYRMEVVSNHPRYAKVQQALAVRV